MKKTHHHHDHEHEHACDCAAHRRVARAEERATEAREEKASLWAAALPVIACAFCPVCLSAYAKVLSIAGVGLGLREEHHRALLAIAVTISIGASGHRAWRSRRAWPLLVAISGSALVVAGHALTDDVVSLHFADGEAIEADRVVLATGFEGKRPGGALLDQAISDLGLRCASCGYPIVDAGLTWHPGLHVTGPLAELEIGPVARNIIGARLAAERLTAA